MEINEELEEIITEEEEGEADASLSENEEELETFEETETEAETAEEAGTVSGGDSTSDSALTAELITLMQENNEFLSSLCEAQEEEMLTAWEKPLETYTPLEMVGVLLLIVMIGSFILEKIGGIVTCKQ